VITSRAKKKICILVFSDIARDGRVLREVEYARRRYEVDVIAYGLWKPPERVNYFQLARSGSSVVSSFLQLAALTGGKFNHRIFERIFWQKEEYRKAVEILKLGQYDLIHANDWNALPVAVSAARGTNTRVLFDAHEYTPAQYNQYFTGRFLKSLYYEYMLRSYSEFDEMITVSDGIGRLYRKKFGWNAAVVRNAPDYASVEFRATTSSSIRLVHHGAAVRGRYLEDLIRLASLVDHRFSLTLILVPTDPGYLAQLEKLSNSIAPDKVRFLDPIPPDLLATNLAAYDMGIHLLRAVNLNHLYALPNKLFDFIMAGLGVAVFPLPEMARIVKEHQIGVLLPDQSLQKMAEAINALTSDQIDVFKKNSLSLAKTLNGNVEMTKLMDIYAKLLSG